MSRHGMSPGECRGRSGRLSGRFALIGLVGGVMLVEGAAIFVATRFLGDGPSHADAAPGGLEGTAGGGGASGDAKAAAPSDKEVLMCSFRAMNDRTGHNIIYDVKVYARIGGGKAEPVQKMAEEKKATLEDRMARVIRAADPQYFKEAGLDTLRRQIKHEIEGVLGEKCGVEEVLIPSLMWYNADG